MPVSDGWWQTRLLAEHSMASHFNSATWQGLCDSVLQGCPEIRQPSMVFVAYVLCVKLVWGSLAVTVLGIGRGR